MSRVAVLDDHQRRAAEFADWRSLGPEIDVDFVAEPISPQRLAERLAGYEVLVLMRERTRLGEHVLVQLPKLQLVVTTGMRNASLDIEHLVARGIPVCGRAGVSAASGPGVPTTTEVAWARSSSGSRSRTGRSGPAAGRPTCRPASAARRSGSPGSGISARRWWRPRGRSGWR